MRYEWYHGKGDVLHLLLDEGRARVGRNVLLVVLVGYRLGGHPFILLRRIYSFPEQ